MLRQLTIAHYALIDSLNIHFDEGLNIITGETGSGKTIILGAMGLLLGERSDSKAVQLGHHKCVVEGHFTIADSGIDKVLRAHDLDVEEPTILRREVLTSGKSRAFVNDTPVNLKVLREIGMYLIDIHSQHHTLQINDSTFQMMLLDGFAGTADKYGAYQEAYAKLKLAKTHLREAIAERDEMRRNLDFMEFQLRELHLLKLDEIDEQELEESLNMLRNADDIAGGLAKAISVLSEADYNALNSLNDAVDALAQLKKYAHRYESLFERLKSAEIEIRDVSRELESYSDEVEADPQRLEELESLQSAIFRMEQKHAVKGVEELRLLRDKMEEQVRTAAGSDLRIEALESEVALALREVMERGTALREQRKKVIPQFQQGVADLLKSLNMPNAKLEVRLEPLDQPGSSGIDVIQFYFSANAGQSPAALKNVASGGELSRLMLAIKCMASDKSARGTIVFDEIDTGVSGEVAHSMGRIMKRMSSQTQILSITHLPQVAAKGNRHFKVFKRTEGSRTISQITALIGQQRVEEIAQMLSGAHTTEASLTNAKELLDQA